MGLPRLRSLHDLYRLDADLEVRCDSCRHVAIFDARRIVAYFHSRGWNAAWETVPSRFRCGRCGSKRVDCGIAPRPKALPVPQPEPIERREPSAREVKEFVRRTRG